MICYLFGEIKETVMDLFLKYTAGKINLERAITFHGKYISKGTVDMRLGIILVKT